MPASIGRIPDDREDILVALSCGAPEIGVDRARPELRGCKAQRDISLAGLGVDFVPAAADLGFMWCTT